MFESSLSQVLSSLERLQKKVASIKEDVDTIKGKSSKHLSEPLAQVWSTNTGGQLQESDDDNESLLTQELVGKTSAETEDASDGAQLVQVLPTTKEHLVSAFVSLNNSQHRQIRTQFIQPNLPFTRTPIPDKMMADECSKSTKSPNHQLAHIQMFILDAVGPLSNILDRINGEIHRIQEDSKAKPEIGLDDVAGEIKAALTLVGNASAQYSILQRTKVLEEYNKQLLSFCNDREAEFKAAVPQLFGQAFAKDASDYLDQLVTICKAKARFSQPVFQKALLLH